MTPQKKKLLILFLILATVLGAVFSLKYLIIKENGEISPPEPTPSPPLFLKVTLTPTLPPLVNQKSEVIKSLPFITENYTIEYLPIPDKFVVTVLNEPFEKIVKEAENWFISQGIDPKDPNIYWNNALNWEKSRPGF